MWPGAPSGPLQVFALSPTSCAEQCELTTFRERAPVGKVARLDTLEELESEEVEAAFWVGAHHAWQYLPKICDAVGTSGCRAALRKPLPPDSLAAVPAHALVSEQSKDRQHCCCNVGSSGQHAFD